MHTTRETGLEQGLSYRSNNNLVALAILGILLILIGGFLLAPTDSTEPVEDEVAPILTDN